MVSLKRFVRSFVPASALSLYHLSLAYLGALLYRFPSKRLVVIGVTGTDGKSSTTEYLNAIFEAAGYATALSNSIRVQVGDASEPGTGRSMPGRFFMQRFLRRAADAGCSHAIIEMTSEGARQYRHRAIELNAFIFTNLSPEHIESHGSLRAYADAKFSLTDALLYSPKWPRVIVANADDAEGERYLKLPVEKAVGFSLSRVEPYSADEHSGSFRYQGRDVALALPGEFSLKNALAAAECAHALGVPLDAIQNGIENLRRIPGRLQELQEGQEFTVVVDYALTREALEGLYRLYGDKKKICVFGCTGGGRDKWKRPLLGKIAGQYCEHVILTNDIAYDEDAQQIIDEIASGMSEKPEEERDRRLAIRRALSLAQTHPNRKDVAVLITGMGVDTEITGADGSTLYNWSDARVAREELAKVSETI